MARDLGVTVNNEKPYVFISYNTEDYERVARIVQGINRQNINIWYDQGIQRVIMEEWEEQIARNILNCDFAVIFISEGVFQKEDSCVKMEYDLLALHCKKVCIVLLDKVNALQIPAKYEFWWNKITTRQCINGYALSEEKLVQELINECRKLDAFKSVDTSYKNIFSQPTSMSGAEKIPNNYIRYQASDQEREEWLRKRDHENPERNGQVRKGTSDVRTPISPADDLTPQEEEPSFLKKYWTWLVSAGIIAVAIIIAIFILKGDSDGSDDNKSDSSSTSVSSVSVSSALIEEPVADSSLTDVEPSVEATPSVNEEILQTIQNASVGDTFILGEIDTDGILENGDEPIEWVVLEKDEGKSLITTACAIECQRYADELEHITWEYSHIREWLNGDFYRVCFDNDEKNFILKTDVLAEKNPNYSTNPGNDTEDYVFLMSYSDVIKYFDSDAERRCTSTEHAKGNDALVNDTYGGTTWWWLRTPGETGSRATIVNSDGSITGNGYVTGGGGVRPCMWVKNEE